MALLALNLSRRRTTHLHWGISISSSTATPPSEHIPLWWRAVFELMPSPKIVKKAASLVPAAFQRIASAHRTLWQPAHRRVERSGFASSGKHRLRKLHARHGYPSVGTCAENRLPTGKHRGGKPTKRRDVLGPIGVAHSGLTRKAYPARPVVQSMSWKVLSAP
jgi:hypothetical protein